MTSQTRLAPTNQDIPIASVWAEVRRGLTPLLCTAALVGAGTYGVLSLMAPRYTSEAQLAIAAKSMSPFPGDTRMGDTSMPRLDKEAINTHARAMMAPDLILKVSNELALRKLPEFNSAAGSLDTWSSLVRMIGVGAPRTDETDDERVLAAVKAQLDVVAAKDSRFIPIRFTSADPQLAADFANRLADRYREGLVATPVEETAAVVKALIPKVEALRKEVLDAESEVERYRSKLDLFRGGTQNTPVNDQRMASLNDELIKVEAMKSEAEARWRTARDLMKSGSAEVVPDVQKSPLVQGLIGQRVRLERQIAESSASLLSGHPRMQQLNAELAGLKRQITSEVQKVVQSLENDTVSAGLKMEDINRQIRSLKTRVVDQSGGESGLKALESSAKSKRTELERLQKQLEDNRTVVNTKQVPVEAQILSLARPNTSPTFPKKGPYAALAASAAGLIGLVLLILRGVARAQASLNAPSSGNAGGNSGKGRTMPQLPDLKMPQQAAMNRNGSTASTLTSKQAKASASPLPPELPEDVAKLAERLVARTDMTAGVRTLVTSEQPGVDVNMEAFALAEAMSESGKDVVLVIWSLSGQGFSIARTALRKPGLTDLLEGKTTFEQVVGRIPGSLVHVIQPGGQPADMHIALDPDRLNLVLDALDEAYDQIVVAGGLADAAPLFEAIEGRFDAAVVISEGATGAAHSGRLLGFEVADIDIVHCSRPSSSSQGANGSDRTTKVNGMSHQLEPSI